MPVVKIFASIKEFLQQNSQAHKTEECVTPDAHQEFKPTHTHINTTASLHPKCCTLAEPSGKQHQLKM